MTELAGIDKSEMENSPEALDELYREDSEGLLADDRTALAWKYSRIYEVHGPEAIEELLLLDSPSRFIRRNELWQSIISLERENRGIRTRRQDDF